MKIEHLKDTNTGSFFKATPETCIEHDELREWFNNTNDGVKWWKYNFPTNTYEFELSPKGCFVLQVRYPTVTLLERKQVA